MSNKSLSEEEFDDAKKSFFKEIIALLLIIIILLWLIPYHSVLTHPFPSRVPSINSVISGELMIPERPASNKIGDYVVVDSQIKMIANKIVVEACSKPDKRCYAEALFLFVRDNIDYVYDPVNEYFELPHETINAGAADCDGMSILLASLLESVGIKSRFDFSIKNHVFINAWVPKRSLLKIFSDDYEWINLDPTCKGCKPGELVPDL